MTNEELTAIYNEANKLDPKRHNPITTERIFSAMRAAIATERDACAKIADDMDYSPDGAIGRCIRMRSNAPHEGPGAASSRTVPLDAVVGGRNAK